MEPDRENQPPLELVEVPSADAELNVPITRIGVETELSRYPIHLLAKKGNIEIHIEKIGAKGNIDLRWEVTYNAKFGPPRQIAYKLDTLVINRRIDEEARPLPKLIRLGSLREIASQLDLGGNTNKVRQALRQNVGAMITAKLKYRTAEGGERTLEADFNRYSAVFTGELLPDGSKADAVYLVLNDIYREVLNSAPVKPLNYEYLKSLPPAPQRFYEIISSRVYAAQKNRNQFAKITYSEFTTCSALTRHFDYESVRVQMSKILKPHVRSKYLVGKLQLEDIEDEQGRPDWMMSFIPGPRARAEYMTFARKTKRQEELALLPAEVETERTPVTAKPKPPVPAPRPKAPQHPLLAELTKRGVGEGRAAKILADLPDSQPIMDQLEWGDHLLNTDPGKIKNPGGFYIYLITENVQPPANFVPSRVRKIQEAEREAREAEYWQRQQVEAEYDEYIAHQLERYIDSLPATDYQELYRQKREAMAKTINLTRFDKENQDRIIRGAIRSEVRNRVPLMPFEEFCQERMKNPTLFDAPSGMQELAPGTANPDEPAHQPPSSPSVPQNPDFRSQERSQEHQGRVGVASATDQLKERYLEWWQRQVQKALDELGMMERGRRLKAVRSTLLNESPERETYRQMLVDGEFEEFNKIAERRLVEDVSRTLSLPAFETWLSDFEG